MLFSTISSLKLPRTSTGSAVFGIINTVTGGSRLYLKTTAGLTPQFSAIFWFRIGSPFSSVFVYKVIPL